MLVLALMILDLNTEQEINRINEELTIDNKFMLNFLITKLLQKMVQNMKQ